MIKMPSPRNSNVQVILVNELNTRHYIIFVLDKHHEILYFPHPKRSAYKPIIQGETLNQTETEQSASESKREREKKVLYRLPNPHTIPPPNSILVLGLLRFPPP